MSRELFKNCLLLLRDFLLKLNELCVRRNSPYSIRELELVVETDCGRRRLRPCRALWRLGGRLVTEPCCLTRSRCARTFLLQPAVELECGIGRRCRLSDRSRNWLRKWSVSSEIFCCRKARHTVSKPRPRASCNTLGIMSAWVELYNPSAGFAFTSNNQTYNIENLCFTLLAHLPWHKSTYCCAACAPTGSTI